MGGASVLIAHVPYEYRGGEDIHVEILAQAYRKIGIEPVFYPESREPARHSPGEAAASLVPVARVPEDFLELWKREKPGFIHLHNAFPTLGPAFFRWVIDERVPLVMTVHNHRFFCTNGLALRDGANCKDCFSSKIAWRPVLHNCNGDLKKSAYHALALTEMRSASLYERAVRKFIAPSPYVQSELLRFGIEPGKIVQLMNPIEWGSGLGPAIGIPAEPRAFDYDVLFAGRLSPEKGILPLLSVFREHLPDLKLAIAGDGSERARVEAEVSRNPRVVYLGQVSWEEVSRLIERSRVGIFPSLWNETFGMFVVECFIRGRPCVVADQDSTRWLAGPGFPGVLADVGNPRALAQAIHDTLARPMPTEDEVRALRARFGVKAFSEGLRSVAEGVLSR